MLAGSRRIACSHSELLTLLDAPFLLTSLTPSGLAMGAVVPGCGTMLEVVAEVVAPPLLLLPPDGGGGRPGGGVPVLPGPQDSIIVGEPHVNGLNISYKFH